MTHTTHSLRLASTAIAAVLALTSTAALPQDPAAPFPTASTPVPQPVIVVPDIPVPAASPEPMIQPRIVLPTELPQPTAVTPPAAVPNPEALPAAPAAPVRTRAPAAGRAVPAPVTPTAVDAPADTVETVAADLPAPIVQEPVAPVAVVEDAAPAPLNNDLGILALILGGLAAIALAIWGFIAIGRRKPITRRAEARLAERPTPVVPKPLVAPQAVIAPEPAPQTAVVEREGSFAPRVQPIFAQRSGTTSGGLPHAGASVALPRELPANAEDRHALFERMVDAKPDRANPFTDRKARMKRARLIMQSLGRDFGEAKPWIDLSQYPNNWPELAAQRHAAA
ncbi:MAG TPA: hypothetical protein VI168_00555 [Croceibacterium sp.]